MINYSIVNERGFVMGLYREFIPAYNASKRFSEQGVKHRMVSLNSVVDVGFDLLKGERHYAK